eukprot:gene29113-82_t
MSNENTTYARDGDKGDGVTPLLWAGSPNTICIVRKLNGAAAYLVTLTIQRMSNAKNNLIMPSAPAAVTLDGFKTTVKLSAR